MALFKKWALLTPFQSVYLLLWIRMATSPVQRIAMTPIAMWDILFNESWVQPV